MEWDGDWLNGGDVSGWAEQLRAMGTWPDTDANGLALGWFWLPGPNHLPVNSQPLCL